MVPWCGFCLFFNHVVVPQSYCIFLLPIFVCTNLLLGDSLASKSWESEMRVFYRRDNYLHVNCSSLKIYLKNYPSPTYSPSHWAEISLRFMGFKNRVFLPPFLICCCIGRVFYFLLQTKRTFGEFRIAETSQQVWCETLLAVNSDLQLWAHRHPTESLFRWTKSHFFHVTGWIINWDKKARPHLFEWSCTNLHRLKKPILKDNLQLSPAVGK